MLYRIELIVFSPSPRGEPFVSSTKGLGDTFSLKVSSKGLGFSFSGNWIDRM